MKTRLALIQMKMSSNKEKNLAKAISKIKMAKKKRCKYSLFTRIIFNKLFLSNRKTFKL